MGPEEASTEQLAFGNQMLKQIMEDNAVSTKIFIETLQPRTPKAFYFSPPHRPGTGHRTGALVPHNKSSLVPVSNHPLTGLQGVH
ncbi:hypothetical protein E2C01_006932 [Portunus trituberculatus]|uniref:Uncharacterized protein n=1 Tax=Portunus trituberculatus TaxID=210409 RepID=A0A5B7D112_PORTR|nr:hypothetical protein [Portunus trituberculatus]